MVKRLALVAVVLACGGASEGTKPAVNMPIPDAAAPTQSPNVAKAKLGVPRDAAFVGVGDLSIALKIQPLVDELTRIAHAKGDVADALGIDPSRPAVLVFASPDASAQAVTDMLRASPSPSIDVCRKVMALDMPGFLRVMIPTSKPEALENVVGSMLVEREGWKHVREGYTRGHLSLVVSDDDAYVAFDLGGQGHHPQAMRGMQGGDQPVPPLDGRALRAAWSPKALAGVSFISGIINTCGALSGDSIDPQQKARIFAEGLKESAGIFTLANFEHGDAELTLSPLAFTARLQPSAGVTLPPPEAFAATPSLTLASARVTMEESAAFLRAWPLPGGDFESFRQMVRDSGAYSLLVGFPHLVAAMPYLDVDDHHDPIMANPDVLKHFDRIEAIEAPSEIAVGVLPAGTPLASAQCALEATYPKCPAKVQLTLGTAVKRTASVGQDHFLKLVTFKTGEPKARFAVLSSTNEAALTAAITSRTASGLHVEISTKDVPQNIAAMSPVPVPAMLTGDASVEDGRFVVRLVGR